MEIAAFLSYLAMRVEFSNHQGSAIHWMAGYWLIAATRAGVLRHLTCVSLTATSVCAAWQRSSELHHAEFACSVCPREDVQCVSPRGRAVCVPARPAGPSSAAVAMGQEYGVCPAEKSDLQQQMLWTRLRTSDNIPAATGTRGVEEADTRYSQNTA